MWLIFTFGFRFKSYTTCQSRRKSGLTASLGLSHYWHDRLINAFKSRTISINCWSVWKCFYYDFPSHSRDLQNLTNFSRLVTDGPMSPKMVNAVLLTPHQVQNNTDESANNAIRSRFCANGVGRANFTGENVWLTTDSIWPLEWVLEASSSGSGGSNRNPRYEKANENKRTIWSVSKYSSNLEQDRNTLAPTKQLARESFAHTCLGSRSLHIPRFIQTDWLVFSSNRSFLDVRIVQFSRRL